MSRTAVSSSSLAARKRSTSPKCRASVAAVASPTCGMPSAWRKRRSVVCFERASVSTMFCALFSGSSFDGPSSLRGRLKAFCHSGKVTAYRSAKSFTSPPRTS